MSQNSIEKWTWGDTGVVAAIIVAMILIVYSISSFLTKDGLEAQVESLQEQVHELRAEDVMKEWAVGSAQRTAAAANARAAALAASVSALEKKVYTCVTCKDEGGTGSKEWFGDTAPYCSACGKKRVAIDLHHGVKEVGHRVYDDNSAVWGVTYYDSVAIISHKRGR